MDWYVGVPPRQEGKHHKADEHEESKKEELNRTIFKNIGGSDDHDQDVPQGTCEQPCRLAHTLHGHWGLGIS